MTINKERQQTERVLHTGYLIIGAGLAGCTLGYLLRKAGADVLALEICDAEKKDKLCAGAMSEETFERMAGIFGGDVREALQYVYVHGIRRRLGEREIRRRNVSGLITMPRKQLDDYALRRYLNVGGKIMDRMSVKAVDPVKKEAACRDLRTGRSFPIRFEVIIGADGAASAARRLITGKRPEVIPSLEVRVPKISDEMLMAYQYGKVGYAWYIPQTEHATVGVGFWNSTPQFCKESLQSFLREISLDADPRDVRGAFLPSGRDILLRSGDNAFFTGDAAGLINPMDGSGIHYALISARCLAEALTGGGSYEEAMRPWTDEITVMAAKAKATQFISNYSIYLKGEPVEPLSPRH